MKLNYHHSGLQFFFTTITLIGRRKLLSKLIDEKHRPELLPLGELIKAALVAFHGAFTLSQESTSRPKVADRRASSETALQTLVVLHCDYAYLHTCLFCFSTATRFVWAKLRMPL